jgi:CRP/FNR family cyclic AMP-dependent transcriptional regulator
MTTTTAVQPALAKHPFVAGLPPRLIEELATLARDVRFERDQVIFREGDDCHDFYLILAGRVGLEIMHGSGTLRVQTLGAGDEFGWSAVLMGRGKHFQARALEPVTALAFDGADTMALCRQDTELGFELMHRLLGVVSGRLQATRLQLLDMYWPVAKRAGA